MSPALHDPPAPAVVASQRIDILTPDDVAAGMALSDAVGWNQTEDDWGLFIGAGGVSGIRDDAGRLVATAATLGYGERAWISLVLVAQSSRHRGHASALMARCIEAVGQGGATPMLDATPDGAAVYARLGFAPGLSFARWEGRSGAAAGAAAAGPDQNHPAPASVSIPDPRDHAATLDRIAVLDHAAQRLDRRFLLGSFLSRPTTRVWLAEDGRGFVITRAGRRAWQIGPLVAADDTQAAALLDAALDGLPAPAGSPVFVDVPSAHVALARSLALRGFTVQRPFVRMSLGDDAAGLLPADSYAFAGPEYG